MEDLTALRAFLSALRLLPAPARRHPAGKTANPGLVPAALLLPNGALAPSANHQAPPTPGTFACPARSPALASPVFPPCDTRPTATAHPGRLRRSPCAPVREAACSARHRSLAQRV